MSRSAADAILRALAAVPRPQGDARPWTTGRVVAVDDASQRVTVDLGGDVPVNLPRVDGVYTPGVRVVVVRDPGASGAGQIVVGPITPHADPPPPLPATGTVTALTSTQVTVSTTAGNIVAGSIASAAIAVNDRVLLMWDTTGQPWVIGKVGVSAAVPGVPVAPTLTRAGGVVTATWAAVSGATSYVVASSTNGGATWTNATVTASPATINLAVGATMRVKVAARSSGGTSAFGPEASITYPYPAGSTQQFTTTIRCTSSGTWRVGTGAQGAVGWDHWLTASYGGKSDVYQANTYGSGELTGFAGYGSQLSGLGAISFDAVTLYLRRNGWNPANATATVTVQGSASGARPTGKPVGSGTSVTSPAVGPDKSTSVALPADVREAMRTGAVKGFVTAGTTEDAGWNAGGDPFRLVVTYTRYV